MSAVYGTRPLPATISEADFQRTVIDTAILLGWRVQHVRPARTVQGWRTPIEGHAGAPDLLLARGGAVINAELKSNVGKLTLDQKAWLKELGPNGRLWRPADWPAIMQELARR